MLPKSLLQSHSAVAIHSTPSVFLPPPLPWLTSSVAVSETAASGASSFGLSYIVNICLPGGLACVLLFFLFRLHDDHRLPSPFDVLAKLRAAWLVTDAQVTKLAGAEACHYLTFLRCVCLLLSLLLLPSLLLLLPINLFLGTQPVTDLLARATMAHLPSGSPLLWCHVIFACLLAALTFRSLDDLQLRLHGRRRGGLVQAGASLTPAGRIASSSRLHPALDLGQGTPSTATAAAASGSEAPGSAGGALGRLAEGDGAEEAEGPAAPCCLLIRGVPESLPQHSQLLLEYFDHLYPGQVASAFVPRNIAHGLALQRRLRALRRRLRAARQREARDSAALPTAAGGRSRRTDTAADTGAEQGVLGAPFAASGASQTGADGGRDGEGRRGTKGGMRESDLSWMDLGAGEFSGDGSEREGERQGRAQLGGSGHTGRGPTAAAAPSGSASAVTDLGGGGRSLISSSNNSSSNSSTSAAPLSDDAASEAASVAESDDGDTRPPLGFRTRRRRLHSSLLLLRQARRQAAAALEAVGASIARLLSPLSSILCALSRSASAFAAPLIASADPSPHAFQPLQDEEGRVHGVGGAGGGAPGGPWLGCLGGVGCPERCRLLWWLGRWSWAEEARALEAEEARVAGEVQALLRGEGRGAGIAFVAFKNAFALRRALADEFWSTDKWQLPPLQTSSWRVSLAPPSWSMQWPHVGLSPLHRSLRSAAVNAAVLLALVLCSFPLAAVTAVNAAAARVDPQVLRRLHSWLAWAKTRSWLGSLLLQFLPNLLSFFSMYVAAPFLFFRLARFEGHLTATGRQAANFTKLLVVFLLNLFLFKAAMETVFQSAILRYTHCRADPSPSCGATVPLDASLLASSSLSALAFLLTSAVLGVSFDLLSPGPWLARQWHAWRQQAAKQRPGAASAGASSTGLLGGAGGGGSWPALSLQRVRAFWRQLETRLHGESKAPVEMGAVAYEPPSDPHGAPSAPSSNVSGESPSLLGGHTSPSTSAQGGDVRWRHGCEDWDPLGVAAPRDISSQLAPHFDAEAEAAEAAEEAAWLQREGLPASEFERPAWLCPPSVEGDIPAEAPLLAGQGAASPSARHSHRQAPLLLEFDFPMYYSFDVTALCIVLLFAPLAPLTVPAGLAFFLYRLAVDKYNFLFLFRFTSPRRLHSRVSADSAHGDGPTGSSSAGSGFRSSGFGGDWHISDRRLLQTVIGAVQVCLCLSLAGLGGVFLAKGDADAVQGCLLLFACLVVGVVYALRALAPHRRAPLQPAVQSGAIEDFSTVLYEEAAQACLAEGG